MTLKQKYDFSKLGLLPYQIAYISDHAPIKIYEKSRRIGITRTQALEDVIDAGIEGKYDVWFSSNNDLNGREYIRYCKQFVDGFSLLIKTLQGIEIVEDNKVFSIEFKNGKRITAVSSSPEQIHGKGGKIVLDEFARRADQDDVWEAASPAALVWGYPIRIISTHNGKSSLFNRFVRATLASENTWSLHRTTFTDAVAQGLADKVIGRELSPTERQQYIAEIQRSVRSATIWQQQFMCEPQDVEQTFLPQVLLDQNARAELLSFHELKACQNLYAGLDVGRLKNLSVLWIVERISASRFITRFVREIQNEDFPTQEKIIAPFLRLPNLRRLCIDATGMGIGLTDYLQREFGQAKVEGITLTQSNKEVMAFRLHKLLSDQALDLPQNPAILADFNSVQQDTTATGKIRLFADTDDTTGSHADYFWACCLAMEAGATTSSDPMKILTMSFADLMQKTKSIFSDFIRG